MALNYLSDTFLRTIKCTGRPQKISDGGGLYILITGESKLWRMKYRFDGKEKTLSFGRYPQIDLKKAREKRDYAKILLADKIDPGEQRKTEKLKAIDGASFEEVAVEWYNLRIADWKPKTAQKYHTYIFKYAMPFLGDIPAKDITALNVKSVIDMISARGALDTQYRVLNCISQILRYAMATGRAHQDVTFALLGLMVTYSRNHHATITDPEKVGRLLKDIDCYDGYPVVRYALKLTPLVFVRPGELRKAEWSEFDFDKREWLIPAVRMKKSEEDHIVPLSNQSIKILEELKFLSGDSKYLFPSVTNNKKPISDNTLNKSLRIMGYGTLKDKMTAHGFRSMASTLLNELEYNSDWIERQLAHTEKNKVRGSYNFASFLPQRHKMMQEWADYLDKLKSQKK